MKRILLSLLAAGIVLSCGNKAPDNDDPDPVGPVEAADYDVFGLGMFPISFWWAPINGYSTLEQCRKMKECGINVVNYVGEVDNSTAGNLQVLDYCKQLGLKMMGQYGPNGQAISEAAKDKDYSRFDALIEQMRTYAGHECYIGEYFFDEPSKELFPAIGEFASRYKAAFPDKFWYVNLFPDYASLNQLYAVSYEDYLDSWLKTPSLETVSYDYYPLKTDGTVGEGYFYNLDLIRAKTRAMHLPFWCFVQTTAFDKCKAPDENELRWLVATSYAFGSKGVQYFCYWQPAGSFGPALVDREGNTTPRYDYAKRLNADFDSIGKALLQCHAEGVIQNASPIRKLYTRKRKFGPLMDVKGYNVNVGCFLGTDGLYKYLAVNLLPSVDKNAVSLTFSSKVKTVYTTLNNVRTRVDLPEDKVLPLTLNAGDALLIEVAAD